VKRILVISAALAMLAVFSPRAEAAIQSFGFSRITANSSHNIYDSLELTVANSASDGSLSSSQIRFTFKNTLPNVADAGEVMGIYVDDVAGPNNLLGSISYSKTVPSIVGFVDFEQSPSPQAPFPGGMNLDPDFVISSPYSFENSPGGINGGESIGLVFNLTTGNTFNTVIAALNSGDLRFGLLVDDDNSQAAPPQNSYVNWTVDLSAPGGAPVPQVVLPEPASMAIWGLGSLFGAVAMYRRKQKAVA
jgi:hypothetical protein